MMIKARQSYDREFKQKAHWVQSEQNQEISVHLIRKRVNLIGRINTVELKHIYYETKN